MRYRSLFIVLLVSLSACTYQVRVVTPEPSVVLDGTATQPVTLPPVEAFTPTPLPPPTVRVLPTFTSTALPQAAGVYPIKFSPNTTYIDVWDSILAGASKTYSISASKGQIMSISIHQKSEGDGVYIPMQITGANGTVLCPPLENTECQFWRGVLPATQEYFVKVTPVNDAMNFTLRVVILPLSASKQTFVYHDDHVILTYNDDFAPVRFPGIQVYKVEPELVLELIDSPFYVKTNLLEAYFLLGSTNEKATVVSCTEPASLGGPENVIGDVNINGNNFVRSEGAGVGAGNIYEQIYHRTVINGTCYEITFFIHYANIGNYAPDAGIKEFDRVALMQRFEGILSGMVIK